MVGEAKYIPNSRETAKGKTMLCHGNVVSMERFHWATVAACKTAECYSNDGTLNERNNLRVCRTLSSMDQMWHAGQDGKTDQLNIVVPPCVWQ